MIPTHPLYHSKAQPPSLPLNGSHRRSRHGSVGVASGIMRPELVMKSIVPVVMAGALGIYGLIIAVIISTGINPKVKSYYLFDGYAHLSSGLACGLTCWNGYWNRRRCRCQGLVSTAMKKGGLSTGDIATQYKYKNNTIDFRIDTESNISTTLTFFEIVPSTKTIVTFKCPDYNSGKLEVQYFHEYATFTSAVALKTQSPTFDLTGTIGNRSFALGAEAGYDTSSGSFTKYTAGISVTNPDSSASVILANKGDMLIASFVHHVDHLKGAGVAEISRRFSTNENTFTVGTSYIIDPLTIMKMRLNNHGKLGALLQHELKPKSILTISGEFDTKALDKNPRFGLALALKP